MNIQLTEQPMNRVVERLTLIFVSVFAVCCVAVAVYQLLWAMPAKRCEDHGWWWDASTRVCAMPVSVTAFTHRPIGAPKPVIAKP
jgi:hypothetical protein